MNVPITNVDDLSTILMMKENAIEAPPLSIRQSRVKAFFVSMISCGVKLPKILDRQVWPVAETGSVMACRIEYSTASLFASETPFGTPSRRNCATSLVDLSEHLPVDSELGGEVVFLTMEYASAYPVTGSCQLAIEHMKPEA